MTAAERTMATFFIFFPRIYQQRMPSNDTEQITNSSRRFIHTAADSSIPIQLFNQPRLKSPVLQEDPQIAADYKKGQSTEEAAVVFGRQLSVTRNILLHST